MPEVELVDIALRGLSAVDASTGETVELGGLHGVSILVLMRHRH